MTVTQLPGPEELVLFDVRPHVQGHAVTAGMTGLQRFEAFHAANPWVMEALVRMARDLVGRGHTRFGIAMLWESLRWQAARHTGDPHSTFKLSNGHKAHYARRIMADHADLAGVFELRRLTAKGETEYAEPQS